MKKEKLNEEITELKQEEIVIEPELEQENIAEPKKKATSKKVKKVDEVVLQPNDEPQEEKSEEPKEENKLELPSEAQIKPVATLNSFSLGNMSNDIKSFVKPVRIENKIVNEFKTKMEKEEILWAKVTNVVFDYSDKEKKNKSRVGIQCTWNGVEIMIPDNAYFPDKKLFGSNYSKMNDEEKINQRYKVASYQIGAIICLVVDFASATNDGMIVLGDRNKALAKLQDFYFTHENYKQTINNTLEVGGTAIARVLAVRSHNVLVECCGVETFIDSFSLANVPVDNCHDVVEVGDVIKVKIKKIYPQDKYITVVGRTCDIEKLVEETEIGTLYLGTLISKNDKGVHTFRIGNGLNVCVGRGQIKNISNIDSLVRGDEIIIEIIGKADDNSFLFGRAVARK